MPRTTARHATTTPTPTTAPIPTSAVAQAHWESREPQGTTLAQTTAQQSSYLAWPPPWTHSQQGTWRRGRVHWQSEPGQRALDETGAGTYNALARQRSCTQTLTPPRHWPSTSPCWQRKDDSPPRLEILYALYGCVKPWASSTPWLPHSTGPYARQQTGPTHTHHPDESGPMRTH